MTERRKRIVTLTEWQERRKRMGLTEWKSDPQPRYPHRVTQMSFQDNGASSPKSGWRINRKEVKECSLAPHSPLIVLSPLAHQKIETAMREMGGNEWLAYLLGEVTENASDKTRSTAVVADLLIPAQIVSAASVHVTESVENPAIIGTVHSHGKGSVGSFSSVDREYILANHPVGLLVGREYKGCLRVSLPCGREIVRDAEVRIASPESNAEFVAEFKAKVQTAPAVQALTALYGPFDPNEMPYYDW